MEIDQSKIKISEQKSLQIPKRIEKFKTDKIKYNNKLVKFRLTKH